MRRLDRADPIKKLPAGVKLATKVPIVVIPSLGVDPAAAGTKLANMRRQAPGSKEGPVRIRFGACCDEHRGQVKLDNLATPAELLRRAKSLSDHVGHGRLDPSQARLEWVDCEPHTPCTDCLELAAERAKKGAAA